MSEVVEKGKLAKAASYQMSGVTTDEKNQALELIADQLLFDQDDILVANQKDLKMGEENGLSKAVLDRIMLNETRIADMAEAIRLLTKLEDPVGEVLESTKTDHGLTIQKKRV